MFLNTSNLDYKESAVFGGPNAVLEGALKNPNQFREAVIYESINSLSENKIKEFVESDEAKHMIEEGYITDDTVDQLRQNGGKKCLKMTVCHMAKEAGDPLWDELVACRVQERRIMNDLMAKYADKATPVADNVEGDFINKCVPEYFRHN